MNPNDIELVRSTWRRALAEPELLHCAITERLNGSLRFRDGRARWVSGAVTQMALVLDRPRQFELVAETIVERRGAVTVADLEDERAALIGAITELQGDGGKETERAWNLAIALFADIVSTVGLDPFTVNGSSPVDPATRGGSS